MSGLFHRLAAQALETAAPVVHSLARIPYVAPLELIEETTAPTVLPRRVEPPGATASISRTESPQPSAAYRSVQPSPPAAGTDRQLGRSVQPGIDQEKPLDATPGNTGRSPDVTATSSDSEMTSRSAVSSKVSEVEHQDVPAHPAPDRSLPSTDPTGVKHTAPRTADFPSTLLPRRPREPAWSAAVGIEKDPTTEASAPAPLLSLSSVLRPAAHTAHSFNPTGPLEVQDADASEATEVQVHIGRIEVTAVHETPPRKERPDARRKPMTLDEYLARREGERR